jgi:hypothetical protein
LPNQDFPEIGHSFHQTQSEIGSSQPLKVLELFHEFRNHWVSPPASPHGAFSLLKVGHQGGDHTGEILRDEEQYVEKWE